MSGISVSYNQGYPVLQLEQEYNVAWLCKVKGEIVMHLIITLKITNVYSFRNYIIQFELKKLYTLKQSHK
jgi:hypothetical protein